MQKHYPLTQFLFASLLAGIISCSTQKVIDKNPDLNYRTYIPNSTDRAVNRAIYYDKLQGFWLGTSIANWTGLVTEMDKIGNTGEIKTGDFYTRHDWGKPDQPSIWGQGVPSDLSPVIDFVFAAPDSIWGADDDSDIEYIWQELLLEHHASILSGEQIRDGWLNHIKHEEENYLWVSNQKAFDLMKEGLVPPATGDPANNPEYEMIDAQLTTEIFGLFAPARPDIALNMALLPVQTTARENSQWISEFYVTMFSLASAVNETLPLKEQILWMAEQAKNRLSQASYAYKMYDFVKSKYDEGIPWEQARDSVYYRYQVSQSDGYDMTSRNLYCNACFASGINFAASLVSLFYGEGDLIETIKIGTLAGWDSDNPTATWGGLLGFMLGKEGVEKAFGKEFSNRFDIHRTRVRFENDGVDTFENMALKGIWVIDRVVQEEMKGGVDLKNNLWYIPQTNSKNSPDWAGTYEGILPCAECEGIRTTIRVYADGTFERTREYIGKNGTPFTDNGKFEWTQEGSVISLIDNNDNQKYQVGENRLFHLDNAGNQIKGNLSEKYILTKTNNVTVAGNPGFEDKKWQLVSFMGKEVKENEAEYYIIFNSKEKRLNTKAGCNVMNAKYELTKELNLNIGPIMSTKMACPENSIEDEYISNLVTVDNITTNGELLHLNRARMTIATYKLLK